MKRETKKESKDNEALVSGFRSEQGSHRNRNSKETSVEAILWAPLHKAGPPVRQAFLLVPQAFMERDKVYL